jgi:hypothetical protein
MTEPQPLDALRVTGIVADALEAALLGTAPSQAARAIITAKRPSVLELAAAARENHEVHGGAPDPLPRFGFAPQAVPEDVDRIRTAIHAILEEAAAQLGQRP